MAAPSDTAGSAGPWTLRTQLLTLLERQLALACEVRDAVHAEADAWPDKATPEHVQALAECIGAAADTVNEQLRCATQYLEELDWARPSKARRVETVDYDSDDDSDDVRVSKQYVAANAERLRETHGDTYVGLWRNCVFTTGPSANAVFDKMATGYAQGLCGRRGYIVWTGEPENEPRLSSSVGTAERPKRKAEDFSAHHGTLPGVSTSEPTTADVLKSCEALCVLLHDLSSPVFWVERDGNKEFIVVSIDCENRNAEELERARARVLELAGNAKGRVQFCMVRKRE